MPCYRLVAHTKRSVRAHLSRAGIEPSGAAIQLRQRAIELFYTEAWGNGTPELLPSLCSRACTYCDVHGGGCDVFGCHGLTQMIEESCSSHPLLSIHVDNIVVDPSGDVAVAEWHALAAHLLPGRSGSAPTGLVSEICGLDEISFDEDGLISSIYSYRDRFSEEKDEGEQLGAAGHVAPAT